MKHPRLVSAGAVVGAHLPTRAGAGVASAAGPVHAVRSRPAGSTIVSRSFAAKAGTESGGFVARPKRTAVIVCARR
jgi:hypothetical protein